MPKATVAAIILDESRQKILLTKRDIPPFRGQWCLPGGHIDAFEAAAIAAAREVREETGLIYVPHFYRYFDEIIPEMGIHAVVLTFVGAAHGELDRQVSEVAAVDWFTWAEAMQLLLAFKHNDIVAAAAAELAPGD